MVSVSNFVAGRLDEFYILFQIWKTSYLLTLYKSQHMYSLTVTPLGIRKTITNQMASYCVTVSRHILLYYANQGRPNPNLSTSDAAVPLLQNG